MTWSYVPPGNVFHNPFHPTGLFQYTLKISKNRRLSDVFRGGEISGMKRVTQTKKLHCFKFKRFIYFINDNLMKSQGVNKKHDLVPWFSMFGKKNHWYINLNINKKTFNCYLLIIKTVNHIYESSGFYFSYRAEYWNVFHYNCVELICDC